MVLCNKKQVKKEMRNNPYHSHRKCLIREMDNLDYTNKIVCLEFGVGDGSSPIFKNFLKKHENLMVHSYENNRSWYKRVSRKYSTPNYFFHYAPSWDLLWGEGGFNGIYDLVFVDQSPWEARIETIEQLKGNTRLFILHDYCYYNKGVVDDIFSVGEGSFFYEKFHDDFALEGDNDKYPPTLMLRNRYI
jgi:hypothetical protein